MLLDSLDFGDRLLSLIRTAMPLDGCCFYRVIEGSHIVEHRIQELSPFWLEKYSNYYWRHDPLHPSRVTDPGVRVRTIGRTDRTKSTLTREYLTGFLAPQQTMYQTELYFRHRSRIVAGASLLRSNSHDSFSENEVRLLEQLVDFSGGGPEPSQLEACASASEWERPNQWLNNFMLTSKERQIAVCMGKALSNKEIGQCLGIALPTVKTHVGRILEKCGESNRIAFLHRFLTAEAECVPPFTAADNPH
ncbi:MAG: helix-turn-helix transcriptional regulator [Rhodobacteraceae bacterium]|nr:helix-turn-helix transcriptional regulator [Paracoccaceae bacterium]